MKKIVTPAEALRLLQAKALTKEYYATSNFAWIELMTDCSGAIPDIQDLNYALVLLKMMEIYRAKLFNNAAITITCGFRSMASHEAVYKKINAKRLSQGLKPLKIPLSSKHLINKKIKGKAIDFKVAGMPHKLVYEKLDVYHFGGLEIRADGLHADNRPFIWRGNDNGLTLKDKYNSVEHNKLFTSK